MSDLKLLRTHEGTMGELESSSAPLEKGLQTQFETHLDTLLGVPFLASEYATSHGARMDMRSSIPTRSPWKTASRVMCVAPVTLAPGISKSPSAPMRTWIAPSRSLSGPMRKVDGLGDGHGVLGLQRHMDASGVL